MRVEHGTQRFDYGAQKAPRIQTSSLCFFESSEPARNGDLKEAVLDNFSLFLANLVPIAILLGAATLIKGLCTPE
jgi:hypothetical protein